MVKATVFSLAHSNMCDAKSFLGIQFVSLPLTDIKINDFLVLLPVHCSTFFLPLLYPYNWHSKLFYYVCVFFCVCCHRHHCVLKFIITAFFLGVKSKRRKLLVANKKEKNKKSPETVEREEGDGCNKMSFEL